jgi:hypothetical protein
VATIAIATGLSIVPQTAWTARAAISQPMLGRQAAQQRAEPEGGQADLEDASTADPVGGGPGQDQEAGQHQESAASAELVDRGLR